MQFRHFNGKATIAITDDTIGIAVCAPNDNFSKAMGRLISGGRATAARDVYSSNWSVGHRLGDLIKEQRPIMYKCGELPYIIKHLNAHFASL